MMLDASANGTLLDKPPRESLEILDKLAQNDYQHPTSRRGTTRRGPAHLDSYDTILAQIASLTNMVKNMQKQPHIHEVKALDSFCELCGNNHDASECGQNMETSCYVGNYNKNTMSNTYNPAWRNHPNLSWKIRTTPSILNHPINQDSKTSLGRTHNNFCQGYNQIIIAPEDQSKTTFTCPYGTFAFRRMPFGLCNAPAKFQRCMTAIFYDLNEDCLEIFMDDFSTFGKDFDSCLSNLEKVLIRCKETNLVLNWEKCHFMVDEGIVLSHKISSKGMEVDQAKIDVISKLPPPTTVKGIRSFLGHAGFYRRFIEDFSKITKSLCSLLEQGRQFDFNEDCTKAFNLLKQKLVSAPIVEPPD
ncbi:hypothetical protein GQ457_12G015110 [Hibiscus cannabinus]